jgi:hypothetical protein
MLGPVFLEWIGPCQGGQEPKRRGPFLKLKARPDQTWAFTRGVTMIQPVSVTIHPEAHIHPDIWCTIMLSPLYNSIRYRGFFPYFRVLMVLGNFKFFFLVVLLCWY